MQVRHWTILAEGCFDESCEASVTKIGETHNCGEAPSTNAPSSAPFGTGSDARNGIGRWNGYDNAVRPHSSFNGRTAAEVCAIDNDPEKLAA